MILVGSLNSGAVAQYILDHLAKDPSVMVFTETTSNISQAEFFPSIDSVIAPIEKSDQKEVLFLKLRPDVLLTFGGMIVSKKIKAFLRTYRPDHHWHLDSKKAYDTFFSLTHHFRQQPGTFLEAFLPRTQKVNSPYKEFWTGIRNSYEKKRAAYLDQVPFSDFKAFGRIIPSIPEGCRVHLANSSTVRYAQLFDMHPTIRVYCNRGTSGIEGSTSTAVGAALHADGRTLLITGDLSFLYDSNGLWNQYLRNDFRIIVINNGGGGIFRILPGAEDSHNFETYFETIQDLDLVHACNLYGLQHDRVADEAGLNNMLQDFFAPSDRPMLLEVCTPRTLNNKILLTYFDFIS